MQPLRPEYLSPWYARLFTSWVGPILRRAHEKTLGPEDLFPLNPAESASECAPAFARALRDRASRKSPVSSALAQTHKGIFAVAVGFGVLQSTTSLATPFLLRELLGVLADRRATTARALAWAGAMVASSSVAWLALNQCFLTATNLALRVRSGLVGVVYAKSLALSPVARQRASIGTIVNMMAKDVENVFASGQGVVLLVMALTEVCAAVVLIYWILGVSSLVGIVVLLLSVPVSGRIAKRMQDSTGLIAHRSDERVSLMGDLLRGIRVIKFYGWEPFFAKRALDVRESELGELRRFSYQAATLSLVFLSTPILVAVFTFSAHVLLGGSLRVADVFPVLAIFGILRPPLLQLPGLFSCFVEGRVSIGRLDGFLALPEVGATKESSLPPGSVELRGAAFSWGGDDLALSDVSLSIAPGELVAIVGSPGAGKTSLLAALVGDLEQREGECAVSGRIAYAPQQAFLVNATVRENVTFVAPFEPDRYARAIGAACLTGDLGALPAGDETEIGERAVNLSGGQKQRLGLARAAYADADVVLLDDPFSALDNLVGAEVLHRCVQGEMRGKTRLLVTHRLDYAAVADRVVVLERGRVIEAGTVAELEASGGRFAGLLTAYRAGYAGYEKGINGAVTEEAPSAPPAAGVMADAVLDSTTGRTTGDEERAVGAVGSETYSSYVRMLGGGAFLLGIVAIFVVRECFAVGADVWLAVFSSRPVAGAVFLGGLSTLGALAAGMTFARALLVSLRGLRAARALHARMLAGVLRAPLAFFESTPSGRVLNRFSRDQRAIDEQVIFRFLDTASTLFALLSSIAVIVLATPLALVAIVPLAWGYFRLQKYFRPALREVNRVESLAHSPLYSQFSETLAGLSSIRAFRAQASFEARCRAKLEASQRAVFAEQSLARWLSLRLDMAGVLLLGAAVVLVVLFRRVAPELGAVSITYAMMVTGVLARAVRSGAELEAGMNSVQRAEQYARIAPERWEGQADAAGAVWPSEGRIVIEGLEMRYRKGLEPALKRISCSIAPGEKIGIVGRTGSGKSTLLLSLFRMVEPERGSIRIDGVDIASIPLDTLRSRLTIIPQDPILFQGTIRSNLDPFETASDDEVWEALERAHLARTIRELPSGLATAVSDGEATLSAGQRQLLCLARAILRKPRILLLDEATASVDHETDTMVQATVRRDFDQCTVLTIAHRVHTVADYDRIMVMDGGKLVEFDTPSALATNSRSVLRQMVAEQTR